MTISSEEFKKISQLARLEFSSEEEESLRKSLGDFADYLEKNEKFKNRKKLNP